MQAEWMQFENSLKTEARFFNRAGAEHLKSVFAGIETLVTEDGKPLVVDAGPATSHVSFYRAREFQSAEAVNHALERPEIHLGPPPKNASAGRMNAQGVSVFYGATDPDAALAEIRPPVGGYALVASFELIRPLRLLDLQALLSIAEGGSVFDPNYGRKLERTMFLKSLHAKLTRPVMPADSATEYLPTQAIADFLATERDPPLDGILFPSVQDDGEAMNVVLFHKAAGVETIEPPKGANLNALASTDIDVDLPYPLDVHDLWPADAGGEPQQDDDIMDALLRPTTAAPRLPTLRLKEDSVVLHQIRKVKIKTNSRKVRRQRPTHGR